MPANASTRDIPDEEWEERKELIRELYIDQNRSLQGDNGVMQHLAQKSNFLARYWLDNEANEAYVADFNSKSQYETRLKKWGFRKYRDKETWRGLLEAPYQAFKTKAEDVYDGVELIPATKVRKAIARYKFEQNHCAASVLVDVHHHPKPSSVVQSLHKQKWRVGKPKSTHSGSSSTKSVTVQFLEGTLASNKKVTKESGNSDLTPTLFLQPNTMVQRWSSSHVQDESLLSVLSGFWMDGVPFFVFESEVQKEGLSQLTKIVTPETLSAVSSSKRKWF